MSDHAEIIRAALEVGWKACWEAAESVKHAEQIRVEWQGYVVALHGLLADHAAETERLRQAVLEGVFCRGENCPPEGDGEPCGACRAIALATAQEPPSYTPAPECPRCGLFLTPGEVHGEHEVGCVAQEPPAECGNCHGKGVHRTPGGQYDCLLCDGTGKQPPADGGDRDA